LKQSFSEIRDPRVDPESRESKCSLGPLGSSGQIRPQSTSRTTALLLLPFGLGSAGYDIAVMPRVYEVTTSIEVAATPQTVWRHVISYADMPEPTDWALRTGLGYPRRVRLAGTGVGAIRYCDFSTGSFVEPITIWEPGKRLEFDVVQSAPPMKEWSPYGEIHPAHLDGYFVSKRGRFVLTPLTNGHTRIEGTSWYQHGLKPGPYWRWWSDAIIHRIHRRVLNHIKDLSEEHIPGPTSRAPRTRMTWRPRSTNGWSQRRAANCWGVSPLNSLNSAIQCD
jgi:hypothetical protein